MPNSFQAWQFESLRTDCIQFEIKGAPPIAADPSGFPDFGIFRKMSIFRIFRWDLGSGRACNGLEMAVGFKWTDSQPISSLLSSFSTIFMILVILGSFPVV